jgi:hypothetical protein
MKPYTANTNAGRTKARDDIHHRTYDGGKLNRPATAKAQRKAARQQGKATATHLCPT